MKAIIVDEKLKITVILRSTYEKIEKWKRKY